MRSTPVSPTVAPTRRSLVLASLALPFAALGPAAAATKTRNAKKAPVDLPGTPLPIPPLVDVRPGEALTLAARAATHAFLKDRPVATLGYDGRHMGPALRLTRGTTARIRLVNELDRPTELRWQGLLVDARAAAGTRPTALPGESVDYALPVAQPAATLWYRAGAPGRAAQDLQDGLCGLLIVDDPSGAVAGLPSTWGVDDLPLILQDRDFDAAGAPVRPPADTVAEHGFRGRTMIVNGVAEARTEVPARLVRLRLLNAASARTFRLAFDDRRPFHLIGTDGGLLARPVELAFLPLGPGERAEILVDFAPGPASLVTEPDQHEHRAGRTVTLLPDVIVDPAPLVAFHVKPDGTPAQPLPTTLVRPTPTPASTVGLPRRRIELRMSAPTVAALGVAGKAPAFHTDAGPLPPDLTINGHAFAPGRIDDRIAFGATEIWEIVSPDITHAFRIEGAQFRVLSEDGDRPKLWCDGAKDTVRVENSAELLVTFRQRGGADRPFFYGSAMLEHADAGMLAAFTVE